MFGKGPYMRRLLSGSLSQPPTPTPTPSLSLPHCPHLSLFYLSYFCLMLFFLLLSHVSSLWASLCGAFFEVGVSSS